MRDLSTWQESVLWADHASGDEILSQKGLKRDQPGRGGVHPAESNPQPQPGTHTHLIKYSDDQVFKA